MLDSVVLWYALPCFVLCYFMLCCCIILCLACPRCTQKLQSRVDGAAGKLSNSKHDAEQADQSINFYPVLDEIESKLPRVQVMLWLWNVVIVFMDQK